MAGEGQRIVVISIFGAERQGWRGEGQGIIIISIFGAEGEGRGGEGGGEDYSIHLWGGRSWRRGGDKQRVRHRQIP